MSIAHISAWKTSTVILGATWVTVVMLDPTVQVAIIGAIPALVSSFIWGWVNHRKISTVEVNTNDKLTKLLEQRDAAMTRADFAEGRQEGAASERDKTP
jgi:hypothetical protein